MEEKNKKCIFHVPNYIEPNGKSGSSVRPIKMLNAFQNIGYEVDVIMGYKKERKEQIEKIKKKIKSGVKYDFLYSESSTMPTLLTEKNHLPTYPSIDFNFMSFCKKKNIKVGLYYRDIYWRFKDYGENLNVIKKKMAIKMYKYDLYKYSKILNILYLQSIEMSEYIPTKYQNINVGTLPPGCEINNDFIIEKQKHFLNMENRDSLNIFYVGGIGNLYNLEPLLKTVNKKEYLSLTVCCRQNEWEKEKYRYEKYINNRIDIVHVSGKELEEYYKNADLCSLYFPPEEYRNFVMPIKLFEYIGHVTPIIATEETVTGDFVKKNNIGWSVSNENELEKIFEQIYLNKEILLEKYKNIEKEVQSNTWKARAKKVVEDLTT